MRKTKFNVGETVMVLCKGKLYEAKIMKVQDIGALPKYFIHYNGWARKYDAWTEEHLLARQSDSKAISKLSGLPSQEECTNSAQVSTQAGSIDSMNDSKKRKLVVDENTPSKKQVKALIQEDLIDEKVDGEAKITIPVPLKRHLVDEWNLITHSPERLLKLPRPVNVGSIVRAFLDDRKTKVDEDQYIEYEELFLGLIQFFNNALPRILLYRQERKQYDSLSSAQNFVPSDIYGGEHLLRVFVRLGKLMSGICVPKGEYNSILSKFAEFLKYLQKNSSQYFNLSEDWLVNAE